MTTCPNNCGNPVCDLKKHSILDCLEYCHHLPVPCGKECNGSGIIFGPPFGRKKCLGCPACRSVANDGLSKPTRELNKNKDEIDSLVEKIEAGLSANDGERRYKEIVTDIFHSTIIGANFYIKGSATEWDDLTTKFAAALAQAFSDGRKDGILAAKGAVESIDVYDQPGNAEAKRDALEAIDALHKSEGGER